MVPLAGIGVVPCARGAVSRAPRSSIGTEIIFLIFSSPLHLGTCFIAHLLGTPPEELYQATERGRASWSRWAVARSNRSELNALDILGLNLRHEDDTLKTGGTKTGSLPEILP